MEDFDWFAPLPNPGTTTVLEASAGTGKTYTIAGMVARFVGEGVPLGQVLAVTFSRRATAELREGIRDRLVTSRATLQRVIDGGPVGNDDVDRVLTAAEPELLATRLGRVEQALGQVDDAPIVTLHTFAKRMLDELGLLADHDRTVDLGSDLDVLADEVIADVYLSDDRWQRLDWAYASMLGRAANSHPSERLHPPGADCALRVGFATAVRAEIDRRKRLLRVLGYDDMIGRLAATLTDPDTGSAAAELLSSRFRVVLVDEFQDTDPQQWQFLEAGFHGRATMMLIGDPKQAIYRFRGGDIETYSVARARADQVLRLGTNHRSDIAVVQGIERLFGPIDLGTPGAAIRLTQINARHTRPRIRGGPDQPDEMVRIRAIDTDAPLRVESAREAIQADLLAQVDLLLSGRYELRNDAGEWRRVSPDDIAVLVSWNKVGQQVHELLAANGQPSVFSGESSVFTTQAAADWLVLLEALETPDRWHLRRAMMTSLVDWTSADIAAASGDDLVAMTALLTRCARLLTDQGVAAVFETLTAERQLYSRLLSRPGGEALVTDLRHVTEILNQTEYLGAPGLTEYLRRHIERANQTSDERTRRLPTDRPAIRVMTVHQAKGLQFPIVLLPQAADRHSQDPHEDVPMVGHVDGVRVLDVAQPLDRQDRTEGYLAEEAAESLRSFYVACTRAQSLLVMWWALTPHNTVESPLHRLLRNTKWDGTAPESSFSPLPAAGLPSRPFCHLTLVKPDRLAKTVRQGTTGSEAPQQVLAARTFRDHIDREWVRTSYTGLTAGVHGEVSSPFGVESDESELPADRAETAALTIAGEPTRFLESTDLGAVGMPASALAPLPGGTQFGSLVHAVLERVDPADRDLPGALSRELAGQAARFPLAGLDTVALTDGLVQTLTTPLGALTDGRSLRELGAQNRLAELDFELPLGAADRRRRVADLAALFETHLSGTDPLHRYGAQLASSAAAESVLAGFLTGSIDVVLRVPGTQPRFVVLDYKTNRVPTAADEQLTARHYTPAAMTSAMCEAHYPLQALLYCAALHRYLAWRLPGYVPDRHLGGVGYLFVRGMTGPDNLMLGTMPSGVFSWQPPAGMIVRASELLAGGE